MDDPGYMDAVRRFKQGVLKDNPIMCYTEVNVRYSERKSACEYLAIRSPSGLKIMEYCL